MNIFSRKIIAGVFLWSIFTPMAFSQSELARKLWEELEMAKSPINQSSSGDPASSDTQTQPPKEELSAADMAFMEAELEEDSVSTGMAAPVRKEDVKEKPSYSLYEDQVKARFRRRSRPASPQDQKAPEIGKNIRERSR